MILVIFSIVQFQWPQRHARYRVGKLMWSRICFDHRTSNLELFFLLALSYLMPAAWGVTPQPGLHGTRILDFGNFQHYTIPF